MSVVELKNYKVHYETYGDKTNPPLLFGHSFLWNSDLMWKDQVAYLSKHYYCITLDLVGHGKSGDLPLGSEPYSLAALADDTKEILEKIGIEKSFIVGLSVGGMWAAHLAVRHPEKVAGLVLMNTDLDAETPERQEEYLSLMDALEKGGMTPEMIDTITPYFFTKENMEKNIEIISQFKNNLSDLSTTRLATITNVGKAIFGRESLLSELEKLEIPVQIITGSEDMARIPAESKRMAKIIPGAGLTVIEGAAHASSVEKPEDVNHAIAHFLEGAITETSWMASSHCGAEMAL